MLVEPRSTAAGCCSVGGGRTAFGTGSIPSACNAGRAVTGICKDKTVEEGPLVAELPGAVFCGVVLVPAGVDGPALAWKVDTPGIVEDAYFAAALAPPYDAPGIYE